jgi:hypothetical protein
LTEQINVLGGDASTIAGIAIVVAVLWTTYEMLDLAAVYEVWNGEKLYVPLR